MEELFLDIELSMEAKKLGFDEPCFAHYHGDSSLSEMGSGIKNSELTNKYDVCAAPLYFQTLQWLRDKHKIEASTYFEKGYTIKSNTTKTPHIEPDMFWSSVNSMDTGKILCPNENYPTFNEAQRAAVIEAFKLIKQ